MDEYCQWEELEISCERGEVIVISAAYYGRMQYGRCIRRDYGYVGCYADVRALADTRCSGHRSCRISVPDKLFDGTTPCPEDLKLYLMAGYTCVKGGIIPVDCLYTLCSIYAYDRELASGASVSLDDADDNDDDDDDESMNR